MQNISSRDVAVQRMLDFCEGRTGHNATNEFSKELIGTGREIVEFIIDDLLKGAN